MLDSRDDRSLLNRLPSPPRPSVPMKRAISSEFPNPPVPGPLGTHLPTNPPPARRHKTSKACTACRQQKSRCDPGDGSADTGFTCRRCRHFNLHCSLSSSSEPNPQGLGPSTSIRTPVLIDITPARRSRQPPPVPVPSAPPKPYTSPSGSTTPKFEPPLPSYDTPSPPRFTVESVRPPPAKAAPLDKPPKAEVGGIWEKALTFVNDLVTPSGPDAFSVPDDIIARGVVSSDEARELTRIWNRDYSVWVTQENPPSFNDKAGNSSKIHQPKSSFLQAVQFYLVARNLPSSSSVNPATRTRLCAEVQHGLFDVMLGGDISVSSIRALQILSLWSDALIPSRVGPGARCAYDGEMLMASAMRIASNMQLELDIQKALKAVDNRGRNPSSTPADEISHESLNRVRFLYSLAISDAILAIGKGRIISMRVPFRDAERIFGSPSKLVTRPGGGPDARLVIQCNLFDIAIRALGACTSYDDVEGIGIEGWLSRVNSHLTQFDVWRHHFAPIIALSDPSESLHINIINIQHQFCRHAFVLRGFLAIRTLWPEHHRLGLGHNIRELITQNAATWAAHTLKVTESLIIESLGFRWSPQTSTTEPQPPLSPLPLLAYAPEYIFQIVLFGPLYFTKAQLVCLGALNKPVPRADTTRGLVMRVLDMLREAAGTRNNSGDMGGETTTRPHFAKRAVEVLQALIEAWDARTGEWRTKGSFNGLAPPVREEQNLAHPFVTESRTRGRDAGGEKMHEREEEDELVSDQDDGVGDDRGPPQRASFRNAGPPPQSSSTSSSHWRSSSDMAMARPSHHHESHPASVSSKPDTTKPSNGFIFDLGLFYDASFILDPSSMLDPSFGFDTSFADALFS